MPVLTKINTNSIAEDAITGDKFAGDAYLANTANQNISGTYSENRLYTSDAYTLSGNATVNSELILSSVKPNNDVVLTAGGAYTITGTGVLSGGDMYGRNTVTGMTGELGSVVTGTLGSGVTGGSGLTALTANTMTVTGGYFFSGLQVFTSSGTWTRPAGVTAVYVIVTGAGGGGGAAGGGDRGGPGGGAGGTAIKWITAGLGSGETITVGPQTADAGQGTVSSFGSHCSGNGGSNESANNNGGVGGAGVSGDIDLAGGGGMGGGIGGQGAIIQLLGSGVGGASYWGGGGRGLPMGATRDGEDGVAYGSGGGGAGSNGAGSKGKGGIVVVYEYKG